MLIIFLIILIYLLYYGIAHSSLIFLFIWSVFPTLFFYLPGLIDFIWNCFLILDSNRITMISIYIVLIWIQFYLFSLLLFSKILFFWQYLLTGIFFLNNIILSYLSFSCHAIFNSIPGMNLGLFDLISYITILRLELHISQNTPNVFKLKSIRLFNNIFKEEHNLIQQNYGLVSISILLIKDSFDFHRNLNLKFHWFICLIIVEYFCGFKNWKLMLKFNSIYPHLTSSIICDFFILKILFI